MAVFSWDVGRDGRSGKKSEKLSCQNDDPDSQKVSQTPYEYFAHSGEAPARIWRKNRKWPVAEKSRKKVDIFPIIPVWAGLLTPDIPPRAAPI